MYHIILLCNALNDHYYSGFAAAAAAAVNNDHMSESFLKILKQEGFVFMLTQHLLFEWARAKLKIKSLLLQALV